MRMGKGGEGEKWEEKGKSGRRRGKVGGEGEKWEEKEKSRDGRKM